MIANSIFKNSVILASFALVSTAMVTTTDYFTRDKIQSEKALALEKILHQIIPQDQHDNDLYRDCIKWTNVQFLGTDKPVKIFRSRKNQQPKALLIQAVAPDGYNGAIELVIGIDMSGKVTGVRVLSHQETPGLGDKIEHKKSAWIDNFKKSSLQNPVKELWKVKKDGGAFDALTGATITPRAVVKAIAKTLQFVEENQQQLYQTPANCQVKGSHP